MGRGIGLVEVSIVRSGAPFRDITQERQQEEILHGAEEQLASLETAPPPNSGRQSRFPARHQPFGKISAL